MLKKMIAQEIQDLKQGGYSLNEVRDHLRERMGKRAPSMPTIRKYYNMDGVPEDLHAATAKPHAFDAEPFRSDVLEILALNPEGYMSSVYDVLVERYARETPPSLFTPGAPGEMPSSPFKWSTLMRHAAQLLTLSIQHI